MIGIFFPENELLIQTYLTQINTKHLAIHFFKKGTGKTTVAASIAFGFVHQCRSISPNHKVLATAFSNCGADNVAEQLLRIGLKVVRVGKASAVRPQLWDYTLDAAIERDPAAKKAMEDAMVASANSNTKQRGVTKSKNKLDYANQRNKRDVATRAVKASIEVRLHRYYLIYLSIVCILNFSYVT